MKRSEFLDILKGVAPAISTKDLVPVLSCACFSEKRGVIFGFDDSVALVTRCAVPFSGAVRGQLLIDWLSAVSAKEVEFERSGTSLRLKGNRAKLELPILPEGDFIFDPPALTEKGVLGWVSFDSSGVKALRSAAISMGLDPGHVWRLGVALRFEKAGIVAYSCDNATASRVVIPGKFDPALKGTAVLLPPRFTTLICEASQEQAKIIIAKDWLAAQLDPQTTLYSRQLGTADLKTYDGVFSGMEEARKKAVEIPTTFPAVLNRALILLKGSSDEVSTLSIKEGKMILSTKSRLGEGRDSMVLSGSHEDVTADITPTLIARGLSGKKSFVVVGGEKVFFFSDSGAYLVSTTSSS